MIRKNPSLSFIRLLSGLVPGLCVLLLLLVVTSAESLELFPLSSEKVKLPETVQKEHIICEICARFS